MSTHLVRAAKVVTVLVAAAATGVAVALASALIGHEVLVLIYGEDLAPSDDTLPMVVTVWTSYLAGAVSAFVVVVLGWRRLVRR